MRKIFSRAIEKVSNENEKIVFITGDLGYNALENVQESMKNRFINAGVAEQNMVGMAAGMAYKGYKVFCYSIAPFIVYRCLEQTRNDVCFHDLPVFLVGNGGGYGYGIMGATHHAIEDIACLSPLPNMTCWIPAFADDVEYCIREIVKNNKPAYLRLGLGNPYPDKALQISTVNHVIVSKQPKITLIALGPIVQNAIEAVKELDCVDIFTILKVPVAEISGELEQSISKTGNVIVLEEHVQRGGLGEQLLMKMVESGVRFHNFKSLHAKGYPTQLYGNQKYYQEISGIDAKSIALVIDEIIQNF